MLVGYEGQKRGYGDFTRLVKILIVSILVFILRPNPVTSCPLGDNPQILNIQMKLYLCILFQKNLQILESSKPKQTTIFGLNHMPLLPLPWAERSLPEVIKHIKPPLVL